MGHQGLFITFEGTEGSGKSTQIRFLAKLLQKHRIPYVLTREPGGSRLSTQLRHWILNKLDYNLMPEAELFLFLADRAQHVKEILTPALKKGKVVLCDRYTDSTLAYQGGGRGFDLKLLQGLNQAATGGLRPDLTVLFDVPVEVGLKRAAGRNGKKDRMEREALLFHQKVRKVFLQLSRRFPGRFLVLDARKSPEQVFQAMIKGLRNRLPGVWKKKLGRVFYG